jgi:protease IV
MFLKNSKFLLLIALVEVIVILFGGLILVHGQSTQNKLPPSVMVVNIDGEIVSPGGYGIYEKRGQNRTNATSASNIIQFMHHFNNEDNIKAFILEIDSFEGQTDGQEELARYIKSINKLVIAVIKGNARNSGYYVAASTNRIYAQESSQIGDLGQVLVYINRERNEERQVCRINSSNYNTITDNACVGFDPVLFERLRRYTKGSHELLIANLAVMRNLSPEYLESLSKDQVFSGDEALKNGLVDEIGNTQDAISYLDNKLGNKLQVIYLKDLFQK